MTVNLSSLSLSGKGSTGQFTARLTSPNNSHCIRGDELPRVISSNSGVAVGSLSSSWNSEIFGGTVNITAVGNGTFTITVQTESGPSASCQVTVAGAGGATTVSTNQKPSTPSVPAVGPTTTTTGQSAGTGTVNPSKYTEVFIVPQSRSRNGSPRITTEFFLKK